MTTRYFQTDRTGHIVHIEVERGLYTVGECGMIPLASQWMRHFTGREQIDAGDHVCSRCVTARRRWR